MTAKRKVFEVVGDKNARWDVEFASTERAETFGTVTGVEFATRERDNVLGIEFKAYYPEEAKDCDGWQLRSFQTLLESVQFTYVDSYLIVGIGYTNGIGYFHPAEPPVIEDGGVDSCFPPYRIGNGDNSPYTKVAFRLTPHRKPKKEKS